MRRESNDGRGWKNKKTSSRVRDERLILVSGRGSEECAAMEDAIVAVQGKGGRGGGQRGWRSAGRRQRGWMEADMRRRSRQSDGVYVPPPCCCRAV